MRCDDKYGANDDDDEKTKNVAIVEEAINITTRATTEATAVLATGADTVGRIAATTATTAIATAIA